jgi:crotonobetaine/carnitine-CoA ligase
MHSQRSFVLAGEGFVERMHLQPEDRILCILPLFHINALFYSLGGTLAAGASIVLAPRFSASGFWRLAAETGATEVNIIAAVGNILARRSRSEFVPTHRLSKVYGAPVPSDAAEAFRKDFGVTTLIDGYGMTEIPGASNVPFLGPHKIGSLGRPALHPDRRVRFAELRVVDAEGRDLPDGETGELLVRTPIAMQGYYRDPEQTAAAFREGWFVTGDLVRRDADGFYHFVARKKDIIRRRGENIAGAELDRVLGQHPDVAEAAAIGVPSELGEEEILVAVVRKIGTAVTAQEIADWCGSHLAANKVPRYVVFLESLPHTPTHRVAKFPLKNDPTLLTRAVDLVRAKGQPRSNRFRD